MNEHTTAVSAQTNSLTSAAPLREQAVRYGLMVCGVLSIFTTIGIIGVLAAETWAFFQVVSVREFFGSTVWTPLFVEKHFGVWPLVAGTFLTSAIAVCTAFPLGILSAVYLSEFTSRQVRTFLKPTLEVLAGIPTVVYGYFALIIVTPILQSLIPGISTFNALSAGIVMGIMIFPIIASLSEDAIFSVPRELREGAYALGGTRYSSLRRVIVPAAFSGIMASVILAVSRAVGETMIVTVAAGQQPNFTLNPAEAIQTMTAYIVQISLGDTPAGSLAFQTIFAVGAALFVITLVMNIIAYRLRKRMYANGQT